MPILCSSFIEYSKYGRTPLELAQENNHDATYQLLNTETLVRKKIVHWEPLFAHAAIFIVSHVLRDVSACFLSSHTLHAKSHTIYNVYFRFCNYSLKHLTKLWTCVKINLVRKAWCLLSTPSRTAWKWEVIWVPFWRSKLKCKQYFTNIVWSRWGMTTFSYYFCSVIA